MDNNSDFIRFLGELVFTPECSSWDSLTQQRQSEYCEKAQRHGLGMLFFRFLHDDLPEPYKQIFRTFFQQESVRRLVEESHLKDFYRQLESAKFPFIPVKGADLAFRIYPSPALRPHGDWDILFRENDCPRVLQMLAEHDWQTICGIEPKLLSAHYHHYYRMCNQRLKQSIEVHRNLPNFGTAVPDDVWQETEAVTEFHRILTPEMNLLLISAHACKDDYTHLTVLQILMDAGYILKHSSVDWAKVHRLADRWGILRPDILFSAWSEFFPAGVLPQESIQPEQQLLIREVFAMREKVTGHSHHERLMASSTHFNMQWFLERYRFCSPEAIRRTYHLQPEQRGMIILYGLRDFFGKLFFFLTHLKKNSADLQLYYEKTRQIDHLVRHEK